jgi:integrase
VPQVPKKTSYLVTKGSRYYFRIRVPNELREAIGKKEHTEALGDLNKAQAEVQAARLGADWQARFLRERHALGFAPHPPAPPPQAVAAVAPRVATLEEVQALATMAGRSMLEADEEMRVEGLPAPSSSPEFGPGVELDVALPDAIKGRSMDGVAIQAESWLGSYGLVLPEDPPARRRMLYVFAMSMAKARKGQKLRDEGEPVDTPPEVGLPSSLAGPDSSTLPPAEKPASALKLRDVYQLWCNKAKKPSAKSVSVAGRVVDIFEEVCGDPPLMQLTRKHGLQLRDHFLSTGMAPVTARDRLGWVTTLLRYEMAEGQRIESDPWTNIKVEGSSEAVIERQAVSPAQMTKLFGHELFQAYKLPRARNAGQDAAYWLPIMGAYTGARITELAQLLVADLKQDGEQWFLSIAASEEWQSVKNKPSERTIPLHVELVRLGLPEYAVVMQKAGHKRLFPVLPVSEVNNAGGAFSSWFSKLKTSSGWGLDTTFHSFRHTVETLLRRAEAYPLHIDKYVGHQHDGGEGSKTYAKVFPEDLVKVAGLIQHDSIALPRVFPPEGWSAPAPVAAVLMTERRE